MTYKDQYYSFLYHFAEILLEIFGVDNISSNNNDNNNNNNNISSGALVIEVEIGSSIYGWDIGY